MTFTMLPWLVHPVISWLVYWGVSKLAQLGKPMSPLTGHGKSAGPSVALGATLLEGGALVLACRKKLCISLLQL